MGISLGIVGLGSFGSSFADLFMNHPLVDRIALCDREPDRIARFAGLDHWQAKFHPRDAYASLDEICASDIDAVALFTQPWLHAPQAVQALNAGKHVYSAVPIAMLPDGDEILDWCARLVETVERTGQSYMLGETTFYRPEAIYCRRRSAEGAFGDFVYSEGEYYHDVDSPSSNLRLVQAHRLAGQAGQEWIAARDDYKNRGILTGPMHYPTHSTSGPMSAMNARALKVCAWGYANRTEDTYFNEQGYAFSNETALFHMSNGSAMRICELREIGLQNRETFRIYGTHGSYENEHWCDKESRTPLTPEEMRHPLPPEVEEAFRPAGRSSEVYGGHGGSHPYLVHEFVEAVHQERQPAIHVWSAVRYMAAGVIAHKSALQDGEILSIPDWGDGPAA
ncbi:MAG: Gfo/Idh/MocA family oxidoreductase [Caldilineaceae bacterium]|nr:Gfo/Idh/MocA family oxidoreductase [Caldilineaceae bacterium]